MVFQALIKQELQQAQFEQFFKRFTGHIWHNCCASSWFIGEFVTIVQAGYNRYSEDMLPQTRTKLMLRLPSVREDKKRKLTGMVNEMNSEEDLKAVQKVLAGKLARIREHKESVSAVTKACEKDAATASSLSSMLDECPVCMDRLCDAVGKQWGAVQLQCEGCSKVISVFQTQDSI
jgi:hypothetical protein